MTNLISTEYAEEILTEIRKEDTSASLIEHFSGTRMYGAECLCFGVENRNAALEAVCRAAIAHNEHNFTPADFIQSIQNDYRAGKSVIYFPSIKVWDLL